VHFFYIFQLYTGVYQQVLFNGQVHLPYYI